MAEEQYDYRRLTRMTLARNDGHAFRVIYFHLRNRLELTHQQIYSLFRFHTHCTPGQFSSLCRLASGVPPTIH